MPTHRTRESIGHASESRGTCLGHIKCAREKHACCFHVVPEPYMTISCTSYTQHSVSFVLSIACRTVPNAVCTDCEHQRFLAIVVSRFFVLLKSPQPLLSPVHVLQHSASLRFQRRLFDIRLLIAQFLRSTGDQTGAVSITAWEG